MRDREGNTVRERVGRDTTVSLVKRTGLRDALVNARLLAEVANGRPLADE